MYEMDKDIEEEIFSEIDIFPMRKHHCVEQGLFLGL